MTKRRQTDLATTAKVFKALGDPTRLKIVCFLKNGEKCVCDIFPHVALSQPTVSRHLKILTDCEILSVRRCGKNRFYSVTTPEVFEMIQQVDEWT